MNPDQLLGVLLRGGLRGGARRNLRFALGMGAVGVAIAAVDHIMENRRAQPVNPGPPPPPPPGSLAADSSAPREGVAPPPLPATEAAPVRSAQQATGAGDAVLLVRAMIAAANADGEIDEHERAAIVERIESAGLGAAERSFLLDEMTHPESLEAIVAATSGPDLAEQVYAVSLLAIRVDTPEEHGYLKALAAGTGLPAETVARLNRVFGVVEPE